MFRFILKGFCLFKLCLLVSMAGQLCSAQSVSLNGVVKTDRGYPPPNGKVVLIGKDIRKEADIDRRTGKFSIDRVPDGTFNVTACAGTSYVPQVQEDVIVKDGKAPSIQLTLTYADNRKPMSGPFKNGKGAVLAALGYECRVAITNVNDKGYYQFEKLPRPPREYRLAVVNKDGRLGASVIVPLSDQETEVALSSNVDKNNVLIGLNAEVVQLTALSSSTLAGRIDDPSGLPAAGVQVSATNRETGLTYTTTTNDLGEYRIQLLTGNYDLDVQAVGFMILKHENVVVAVASAQALDFTLAIGNIGSTVEVTADPPTIDVTQTTLSASLGDRVLQDLPLNGRRFADLSILTGAAQRERDFGSGLNGVSINGQRPNSVNILIDGVSANPVDNSGNLLSQRDPELPYGTVAVHRTSTHETAELGIESGGTIEAQTKGGTNEVRGEANYWNLSSALGARDFFEIRKSHSLSHQFGLTIGGPIVKDRHFYFGGYEGRRELDARSRIVSVPSTARLDAARLIVLNSGLLENPLSTRLLNFFPPADRPGAFNNRTVNSPAVKDVDNFFVRIDPRIGPENANISYNFVRTNQLFPFRSSFLPNYRVDFSGASHALSGNFVVYSSPNQTNQAWVRYERSRNTFRPEDINFNPLSIGLNTGVTDPQRFGLPFIKIVGFDVIGSPVEVPSSELLKILHLKDTMTVVTGMHTIRFGADVRRTTVDIRNDAATRGRIIFDGTRLGDPLADFLAGFPGGSTGIVRGDTQRALRLTWVSAFVQEDMRARPNLTFTLGLRYSLNGAPKEKEDRLSTFLSDSGGLVRVGTPQLSDLHRTDFNNVAPRLGFAWSPGGSEDLVIRASWGIFFDHPSPRLFIGLCPCPNSLSAGATMNPVGSDSVVAQRPLQPIPFGIGIPVFTNSSLVDISAVDQNLVNPRIQNFYLGMEYSPVPNLVFDVGYSGSTGDHLYRLVDINQPIPGDVATRDIRRPFFQRFPEFGSINQLTSLGKSNYHSLRTHVRWQRANKLWLQGGYTFSNAVDDATDASEIPQDSRNLRAERFSSRFEQRHRVTLSWRYELPSSKNRLLSGWHLSGVMGAESGNPFTPLISFDNSGTGTFMDRPNSTGSAQFNFSRTQLYTSTAFAIPPAGTFGNTPRNALVGPTLNFLDLSIIKRTKISDTREIEFRGEIYNLFNHPNFRLPNNMVDEPAFGSVNATDANHGRRRIKLGLRFVF